MKELAKNETHKLVGLVDYDKTKVAHAMVNQNASGMQVLMALDEGMKIGDHSAQADVTVLVVEGEVMFNVAGKTHRLSAGDVLTMTPGQVHNLEARKPSKILLTKLNA